MSNTNTMNTAFRRETVRPDGITKIEVYTFGTGKRFNGTPSTGHWKIRGFKKDGKFAATLAELKEKLA